MTYLYGTLFFCSNVDMKEILPGGKRGNWPQRIFDALQLRGKWKKANKEHEITPVNGLDTAYEVTLPDGKPAGLHLYEDYDTGKLNIDIFHLREGQ